MKGSSGGAFIGNKYCTRGNIFHSDNRHASPFWKGVILAAQAVKFGYRWVAGNGGKVRFWVDTWFRTTPLVIQFWELYCIYNKKTKTLGKVWVERGTQALL
jgi:hypothetical protein